MPSPVTTEAGVDVVVEDGPAPAVFERLVGVPEASLRTLDLFDQDDLVEPGERVHRLGWPAIGSSRRLRDNFRRESIRQVVQAREGQVARRRRPAVLPGDDVVDRERHRGIVRLGHPAVFAGVTLPLAYLSGQRSVHQGDRWLEIHP